MMVKMVDTHYPYLCAAFEDRQKKNPALRISRFYCALSGDDDALRDFFSELKARNLWDRHTLVVVSADHAPNFLGGGPELLHFKFDPLDQIPVIFASPNLKPFRRLDQKILSCQIDLAPTLLPLMGGQAPNHFMGRDLLRSGAVGRAVGLGNDGSLCARIAAEAPVTFEPDHVTSDDPLLERAIAKWFNNFQSSPGFGAGNKKKTAPLETPF
jgi:hypothetical protein